MPYKFNFAEVEDRPLSDNENVHRCTPPILLSKREGNPCTLSSTISEESACSSQGIVRFLNRVFGNSNDVLSSPETSAKLDPDFDPLKLELDTSKDKGMFLNILMFVFVYLHIQSRKFYF